MCLVRLWQLAGQLFKNIQGGNRSPLRLLAPASGLCGVLQVTKGVPSGSTLRAGSGTSRFTSFSHPQTMSLSLGASDNTSSKSQDFWLPQWPCEEPTAQQLEEYFKAATPLVTSRGYDYDVRGEMPPSLLHLSQLHNMSGMTELSATEAGGEAAAQKHNMQIRKMAPAHVRGGQQTSRLTFPPPGGQNEVGQIRGVLLNSQQ